MIINQNQVFISLKGYMKAGIIIQYARKIWIRYASYNSCLNQHEAVRDLKSVSKLEHDSKLFLDLITI